jgi:hypothetical protein
MRVRIATTVAVIAAAVGIATTVAGPVYTAFGGDHSASTTHDGSVLAGRSNSVK